MKTPQSSSSADKQSEVTVEIGAELAAPAFLALPENAEGLVLFAHGSGSSRHSPRNRFVAEVQCCASASASIRE